jgi:hypothetical protein
VHGVGSWEGGSVQNKEQRSWDTMFRMEFQTLDAVEEDDDLSRAYRSDGGLLKEIRSHLLLFSSPYLFIPHPGS